MEWQPIETAPKDGTRIFVWQPDGRWRTNSASHGDRGEHVQVVYWHNPYNSNSEGFWVGGTSGRAYRPTHWMPLPSPPSSTAKE